jgi:hypothetical protein
MKVFGLTINRPALPRPLADWLGNPLVRGAILYLVLPNLFFFLVGREFFINRARINSDYLLLWIASSYLSRRVTGALYFCLVLLDLVLSTESIYQFSTVEMIVMAGEFLDRYAVSSYVTAGVLLLLAIAVLPAVIRRGMVRPLLTRRNQIFIGTAALALSVASVVRSADPYEKFLETFGATEIVASGIVETGLASYKVVMASDLNQNTRPAPGAATSGVVHDLSLRGNSAAPYNIAVILVESQGMLKSEGDMRRVLAPLIDAAIQNRYKVNMGTVRFFGATMFGELRTLCRIYMPQAVPQDLPGLDRCLPSVLSRLGYQTVSFHGFDSWLYERPLWYPKIGFQRSFFGEQLRPMAPPSDICTMAIKVACDTWIAGQVERELQTPEAWKKKKFVYWVTLNSHLPVNSELARESSFDCLKTATLAQETKPCELAKIHYQLYLRIKQLVLDPDIAPTRFILVGDHMPPFVSLEERALYDLEHVPFVELVPRTDLQASGFGY